MSGKNIIDSRRALRRRTGPLHVMLMPAIVLLLIYNTAPLIMGAVVSMENFKAVKGIFRSKWVGLSNFQYIFQLPDTYQVFRNTLIIAVGKIICTQITALVFALLLSELKNQRYIKVIQTIVYLPHFLSWVILAVIFRSLFDSEGAVNMLLMRLGLIRESIWFLGSNDLFQGMMIFTDTWKEFGYAAVIYIAALSGINPELYESAALDGASHIRRVWHITLPGISGTVILVGVLQISHILSAGFDQIYNLAQPVVYETGDIIDTYVYRMGLENAQYSISTAVGLTKSAISFVMIVLSQYLAKRYAGYQIF